MAPARCCPGSLKACLNGLLSVWYIVISDDSNASRTCIQAAANKEGDRQLGE